MYSMTGYGKGEYCENGVEFVVELKSVNNRYLDIAVKSARIFLCLEDTIRRTVREYLSRGHVDVYVSFTDKREKEKEVTIDWNAVRAYAEAAKAIGERYPELQQDAGVSFFLRQSDVIRQDEIAICDDTLKNGLMQALTRALVSLTEMRRAEGERLKEDILCRVGTVSALRDKIALRAPHVAEEYRKKLTERIGEYLAGKADETRILTEAAVFADKCNIDEELTRLSSHIEEFYSVCGEERVGRKLDFLIQEFNRECNTVCSKSCDGELTASALEMKNEIEKIREQIQNLE